MFFALMPTESGDAITGAIDCGIAQLHKILGVKLTANRAIIDRSFAMKHGVVDSTVFPDNLDLNRIMTCLEHLLFAGKCPGSKEVQTRIQVILKQLHKCTSEQMVHAVLTAETARYSSVPEYAEALAWLADVTDKWSFYVTSAGFPGIMPSAQCVESFHRIAKVVTIRMYAKLNVFVFETLPEILKLCSTHFSERVVHTRTPPGLLHVVCSSTSSTSPSCRASSPFPPRTSCTPAPPVGRFYTA